MTLQIIPFDTGSVPAAVKSFFGNTAGELTGNSAGGGFPVISIKGKVFHVVRGAERTLITKPGEDDPAASIEVVILRANPNRSKVYYAGGYVEGSTDKPACYSNNGVEPEKDAQEPQSKKCATCPHNQWGSRVTESGAKGKSCSDSRRIAVATVDAPADPMLLRVPAASMKALEEYGKQLDARGLAFPHVVTKVGFDYAVAHPALTFRPVGLIGDVDTLKQIKEMRASDMVAQIVGLMAAPATESEANVDVKEPPKVAAPAKAEPKAETKAETKAVDAAVATAPKAAKSAKPAPTPAPPPASVVTADALEKGVEDLLGTLDFDD